MEGDAAGFAVAALAPVDGCPIDAAPLIVEAVAAVVEVEEGSEANKADAEVAKLNGSAEVALLPACDAPLLPAGGAMLRRM